MVILELSAKKKPPTGAAFFAILEGSPFDNKLFAP